MSLVFAYFVRGVWVGLLHFCGKDFAIQRAKFEDLLQKRLQMLRNGQIWGIGPADGRVKHVDVGLLHDNDLAQEVVLLLEFLEFPGHCSTGL